MHRRDAPAGLTTSAQLWSALAQLPGAPPASISLSLTWVALARLTLAPESPESFGEDSCAANSTFGDAGRPPGALCCGLFSPAMS